MYRLLIITDSAAEKERIANMTGWETMGFKPPHIRENEQDMQECMKKHAIDAMAIDASPAFDGVRQAVDRDFPYLPLFQLAPDNETQMRYIRELGRLLGRLNADDSDDPNDAVARLNQYRERWMKRLISGMVTGPDEVQRLLQLYRFRENADQPCLLYRLNIPEDDVFLSERWHYGGERLETALRNFYGISHDHMLFHIGLVSPQEIRIAVVSDRGGELNMEKATDYIRATADGIRHYLGLPLDLQSCDSVPHLRDFAV